MTSKELASVCGLDTAILGNPDLEIDKVYCCDLLSIVMGKAPANSAWVTVMANINSVAVASLAEIGVIVLADSVQPDQNVLTKAEENGINILLSKEPIFETATKVYKAIN